MKTFPFKILIFSILIPSISFAQSTALRLDQLRTGFHTPPASARPGVYWYFMDGNMSKSGMTKDLQSMVKAGIGHVLFLEVNVGVPRGKVDFLSEEWQNLFQHAVREAERLNIAITLGVGPGWTGSGGPWVNGSQSMKHLVASSIQVTGNQSKEIVLSRPEPQEPYFGEGSFTPELRQRWLEYYEDVAVVAFPTPKDTSRIKDIDEKALVYRAPYSSVKGVKEFLPMYAKYTELVNSNIAIDKIIDLSQNLKSDGRLDWKVPPGNWTILRLGSRNNGAVTRPAPLPGVGFEADKFDTTAINDHLDNFTNKLLAKIGVPDKKLTGGLKMLHMDSWEMGAQNWSATFRAEFQKRRGYDPLPYYPAYSGFIVGSLETSERFLWDVRQTAQELVIENHAIHLKKYAHKNNMGFSIEPYDMNPTADLQLGAVADVPMCEFWSKGFGFNSTFSCIEATSIAHIEGKGIVAAEAFTGERDAWKQYPGSMKDQGDWAFAIGINRFVYHTFQHQSLSDSLRPGMTMGPYGVHHDRNQTWWPVADAYHDYISRCQYLLQQGRSTADILYLTPEGAPQVFRAPYSALTSVDEIHQTFLPDKRGYNFDGCSPSQLASATVKNNLIVFAGGATYRILVLPRSETMTPALMTKIESLVLAGATVVGSPPEKSPSLQNYPECDRIISEKSKSMWKVSAVPAVITEQQVGNGKIYWGGALSQISLPDLYPTYESVAALLRKANVPEDFESSTNSIRYNHHMVNSGDFYFVSNKTDASVSSVCTFRVNSGTPELWDPVTSETRVLPNFKIVNDRIQIPLEFDPFQSYFIVFIRDNKMTAAKPLNKLNFAKRETLNVLKGAWNISFDPAWGGPKGIVFEQLEDWTKNSEPGIKYYSGTAIYSKTFDFKEPKVKSKRLFINLGTVKNIARVRLNGQDMGVIWTAPWTIDVTKAIISGPNKLEIEITNLWPNRLIGDEHLPDDGIKDGQWPDWLLEGKKRTSGRFTFTTFKHFKKDSPLLESGLLGPVSIQSETF